MGIIEFNSALIGIFTKFTLKWDAKTLSTFVTVNTITSMAT